MEKFFDEKISPFVFKYKYYILGFSAFWFIFTGFYATKMGPMTKAQDFIDPDHPIMKPIKLLTDEFGEKEDKGTPIYVYWGVSGINLEDSDRWDPLWVNSPTFD